MVRGEKMLAPVLDPFHRSPNMARRKWNEEVLGIELSSNAKAAAHIELDQVNVVFLQLHHRCKSAPVEKIYFRSCGDGEMRPRNVPLRDESPGFHWRGRVPMRAEEFPSFVLCRGERFVGIAKVRRKVGWEVGPVFLKQQPTILCGSKPVRNRIQAFDRE